MPLLDVLRAAVGSLLLNRLRSLLTTLGIVIGVGAVVALVSLGRAVESYIAAQFEILGANVLVVESSAPESPTRVRLDPLTTREAADLNDASIAPSLRDVTMIYRLFAIVTAPDQQVRALVDGVSANYQQFRAWDVLHGTFFSAQDERDRARVALLGLDIVEALYGDRDYNPTGELITINDRNFTVIGVMSARGGTFASQDNLILIPLSTAQTRLDNALAPDGSYKLTSILARVADADALEAAQAEIESYLTDAHDIVFRNEMDFSIRHESDLLDVVRDTTGAMTTLLGAIAGISLLVGGIGIMNIMLVTVTERTNEIGLRKALGAPPRTILGQFLIESVLLCVIGGLIGVGLGWGVLELGGVLLPDLTLTLSLDGVLIALLVSGGVGMFFGIYPANRAARLNAIDALRYE